MMRYCPVLWAGLAITLLVREHESIRDGLHWMKAQSYQHFQNYSMEIPEAVTAMTQLLFGGVLLWKGTRLFMAVASILAFALVGSLILASLQKRSGPDQWISCVFALLLFYLRFAMMPCLSGALGALLWYVIGVQMFDGLEVDGGGLVSLASICLATVAAIQAALHHIRFWSYSSSIIGGHLVSMITCTYAQQLIFGNVLVELRWFLLREAVVEETVHKTMAQVTCNWRQKFFSRREVFTNDRMLIGPWVVPGIVLSCYIMWAVFFAAGVYLQRAPKDLDSQCQSQRSSGIPRYNFCNSARQRAWIAVTRIATFATRIANVTWQLSPRICFLAAAVLGVREVLAAEDALAVLLPAFDTACSYVHGIIDGFPFIPFLVGFGFLARGACVIPHIAPLLVAIFLVGLGLHCGLRHERIVDKALALAPAIILAWHAKKVALRCLTVITAMGVTYEMMRFADITSPLPQSALAIHAIPMLSSRVAIHAIPMLSSGLCSFWYPIVFWKFLSSAAGTYLLTLSWNATLDLEYVSSIVGNHLAQKAVVVPVSRWLRLASLWNSSKSDLASEIASYAYVQLMVCSFIFGCGIHAQTIALRKFDDTELQQQIMPDSSRSDAQQMLSTHKPAENHPAKSQKRNPSDFSTKHSCPNPRQGSQSGLGSEASRTSTTAYHQPNVASSRCKAMRPLQEDEGHITSRAAQSSTRRGGPAQESKEKKNAERTASTSNAKVQGSTSCTNRIHETREPNIANTNPCAVHVHSDCIAEQKDGRHSRGSEDRARALAKWRANRLSTTKRDSRNTCGTPAKRSDALPSPAPSKISTSSTVNLASGAAPRQSSFDRLDASTPSPSSTEPGQKCIDERVPTADSPRVMVDTALTPDRISKDAAAQQVAPLPSKGEGLRQKRIDRSVGQEPSRLPKIDTEQWMRDTVLKLDSISRDVVAQSNQVRDGSASSIKKDQLVQRRRSMGPIDDPESQDTALAPGASQMYFAKDHSPFKSSQRISRTPQRGSAVEIDVTCQPPSSMVTRTPPSTCHPRRSSTPLRTADSSTSKPLRAAPLQQNSAPVRARPPQRSSTPLRAADNIISRPEHSSIPARKSVATVPACDKALPRPQVRNHMPSRTVAGAQENAPSEERPRLCQDHLGPTYPQRPRTPLRDRQCSDAGCSRAAVKSSQRTMVGETQKENAAQQNHDANLCDDTIVHKDDSTCILSASKLDIGAWANHGLGVAPTLPVFVDSDDSDAPSRNVGVDQICSLVSDSHEDIMKVLNKRLDALQAARSRRFRK